MRITIILPTVYTLHGQFGTLHKQHIGDGTEDGKEHQAIHNVQLYYIWSDDMEGIGHGWSSHYNDCYGTGAIEY